MLCPLCHAGCKGNQGDVIAYCTFGSAQSVPHNFLYYSDSEFDFFIRFNSSKIELVMNKEHPYISVDSKIVYIEPFEYCQSLEMIHKYFKLRLFF